MKFQTFLFCGMVLLAFSACQSDPADGGEVLQANPDRAEETVEGPSEDFYSYLKHSEDFRAVNKDTDLLLGRWNKWLVMPWRYKWPKLTLELAREMREAGINGGEIQAADTRSAEIFERAGIQFYIGHSAGKGDLYLRKKHRHRDHRRKRNRPVCLLAESTRKRLWQRVGGTVSSIRTFENRVAYALDDEISWSSFTSPSKWDNSAESIAGFKRWLVERYGSEANVARQWGEDHDKFTQRLATPDDFQHLYGREFRRWNLSAWVDAISYMDSQLMNTVGELVDFSNELDPVTPAGFVGGQAPAAYGGYNYAKVMPKVQFLESYDIGCSMEIIRSFNREHIPVVQTGFAEPDSSEGMWLYWYYLAHGNRGVIPWAAGWFNDEADKRRRLSYGEYLRELERISRLIIGAEWVHDGVAIYYSHPSIQIGWFIDSELHGKTWINRSSSLNDRLATSIATAWAWTKLLEDHRLQYNWVSYRDAVLKGIDPQEYPLLVLPAVFGLSDAEVVALRRYVRDGGTLIADHQVGLFDHHGKGRSGGALDDLFGITKHPPAAPGRLFGGRSLTEFNPERYYKKRFLDAADEIRETCRRSRGYVVAERELGTFIENDFGDGRAILLNVSVVEYLNRRQEDFEKAVVSAQPIMDHVLRSQVRSRVSLNVGENAPRMAEVTYWRNDGRIYCFVVKNPLVFAKTSEAGDTYGSAHELLPLTIRFEGAVRDLVNERTGTEHGDTDSFTVEWKSDEAVVFSFLEHSLSG